MAYSRFSEIEPLIESQKVLAGLVAVNFRCPGSTRSVRAQAVLGKLSPRRQTLWSRLQRSTMAALADALGAGEDGAVDYRREDVQAAIVAAFDSVQTSFRWDESECQWSETSVLASSFQERLRKLPFANPYDQTVLVRTLLELSKSDGVVSTEELLFVSDFVSPQAGSLEQLIQMEALTPEELAMTTEDARPSIVMLAWACAMCDESLDPAESARIDEIAACLGVSATESASLRSEAQQFLMRQALASAYVDGVRDEDIYSEVTFVGEQIGVDEVETDELDRIFRDELGFAS